MKVFLSYARADGESFATRLRDDLSSAGLNVWRDIEAMVAPEDWREQLRNALRKVDAVVLLLTPGAAASQYVTIETEIALALQKTVIPVLCLPTVIPESFIGAQRRDLSQPSLYTRELFALTRDLRGIEEAARAQVLNELSAFREDKSLATFHLALEKLQRWLNANAYETKIISAVGWLLKQMSADARPDRPARVLIQESIEGDYVQQNWSIYDLFVEQKPIFELILATLIKSVKDDAANDRLRVPIVLAVMNETEAQELACGSAFDDYPKELRDDFDELQAVLAANGFGDWMRRYRGTPQEWRPFTTVGEEMSIGQLVEGALREMETAPTLAPRFVDIRTLDNHRSLLRELRTDGCIVVVDSISMRHPAIQRAFQQSLLDAYSKTSVVNLAPIQSAFEMVRRMRVFLRLQVSELEFDKRRRDRFEEYGGCREIYEREEFEQWLADRVRRMFTSRAEIGTGIRPHTFALTGVRR